MKLTKNFDSHEFDCHNGAQVPERYLENCKLLAQNLQRLRDFIGESIRINSGYRTAAYNKKIGGARESQHLTASAADIATASYTPKQLAAIVEKLIRDETLYFGGLGIYPSWIHVDIRKNKARW